MLKTNLSTRPFYNERSVHLGLIVVLVVVVVITGYNVNRIITLSARNTALATEAGQADARATALRQSAAHIRAGIDQKELDAVSAAAREANGLISHRTFSWTELFNRFESTLPPDVRITAVTPTIAVDGSITLDVSVVARRVEDVNTFMNRLEGTGAFLRLLSRNEHWGEDGLLQANLESTYVPHVAVPPAAPDTKEPASPATPPVATTSTAHGTAPAEGGRR
jgi:Tfp pilus assembly protein PilN